MRSQKIALYLGIRITYANIMYVRWVIEESSEVHGTELVISFANLAEQLTIGAHVSHGDLAETYRIFPCIDAEFQKFLLIEVGCTGSLS